MAILPLQLARVSNQLRANLASNQISRTQQQLLEVQNQLSTGHRINSPSDDPGGSAIIQQLQKTLEQRTAYADNLKHAQSQLGEVDSTLGDLSDLLQQAQSIASANVGSDAAPDARASAAAIVASLYNQAMSLANKQFGGVYLFGGDQSTAAPFVSQNGGMQFVGSTTALKNTYDENTVLPFTVDAQTVFGALSTQARGATNIGPSISATTRLGDLDGALGNAVQRGSIQISNGAVTKVVDLSNADTIGDVINQINAAGVGTVTAGISGSGDGITLSAGAGDNITVTDLGGGTTAADIGLLHATPSGAGIDIVGSGVQARVTALTSLSALRGGSGIDPTGIKITNGAASATISFAGLTTVEGLLNAINGAKVGVRAQINSTGTGIDILNASQGTPMSIAETGGTSATELGVRTYSPGASLTDLNGGKGLALAGGADIGITRQDGSNFSVDLNGAATVQDVIDAINLADASGGVTASFATNGNGIVLTDTTGGPGTLSVSNASGSTAAGDLGLTSAAVGNTVTGSDVNPVTVAGVFANLGKLRDALQANDTTSITTAAQGIQGDYDRSVRVRGQTGAQVQELEARQNRLDDQNIATKGLMGQLQDTDVTDAISKFQTLQNALQASLQTTSRVLNLSLLDYLQ